MLFMMSISPWALGWILQTMKKPKPNAENMTNLGLISASLHICSESQPSYILICLSADVKSCRCFWFLSLEKGKSIEQQSASEDGTFVHGQEKHFCTSLMPSSPFQGVDGLHINTFGLTLSVPSSSCLNPFYLVEFLFKPHSFGYGLVNITL